MATSTVAPAVKRAGHGVTMGCSTAVKQPAKYLWYKNGVLIGGSTNNPCYTTPPYDPIKDPGTSYTLVVIGADGTQETAASAVVI